MTSIKQIFRPSLTSDDISCILSQFSKNDGEWTPQMRATYNKLTVFAFKAGSGITKPAGIVVERESVSSQLLNAYRDMTSQEKREAAFKKWQENSALCTAEELELVDTYRFESGMMNKEEIMEFLSRMPQ